MRITKDLIGQFVTRTKPVCYQNGTFDRSYIGGQLRVLNVTEGMAYLHHPFIKAMSGLDLGTWGDNWETVDAVPDTGCAHKLAILSKRQFCYDCGVFIGHLAA